MAFKKTAYLPAVAIRDKTLWALAGIVLVSALLNFTNLTFPVGFHPDELKKGLFVVEGTQDFKHPLLLLQLTRIAAFFGNVENPDSAVLLGRGVSAVAGVIVVVLSYFIARYSVSKMYALLVAAATAVSPILVIHAHYMKEDVLFTACALLSLWLFLRYVKMPTLQAAVFFGMALGLTFSAHYKSLSLSILFLAAPVVLWRSLTIAWWRYFLHLAGAFVIAGSVFCLVNWPLFYNFPQFIDGVRYEADHALEGHTVAISPFTYLFSFHFLHSLMPGMTPLAALSALVALLLLLWHWQKLTMVDRIVLVYVLLIYFVMESFPLKPAPDFSRYVLPIVPALFVVLWRVVSSVPPPHISRYRIALLVIIVLGIPAYDTMQLVYYLDRDTRSAVVAQLKQEGLLDQAYFEAYAHPRIGEENVQSAQSIVERLDELRSEGYTTVVASSFQFDRYYVGAQLPNQTEAVYKGHRRYEQLFSLPYREIMPANRSYAFSNPVLRIVDIRQPN